MSDPLDPPELPEELFGLVEDSNLELVQVGGMCVGTTVTPRKWVLLPKDRTKTIKRDTERLQLLAACARLLSEINRTEEVPAPLRERAQRLLNSLANSRK